MDEAESRLDLVAELRARAAYYLDRPAVPRSEYPAAREISARETDGLVDLLRRAANALAGR